MPFVIIDTAGQPLRDLAGDLIVLNTREEAARWTTKGERVELRRDCPRRNGSGNRYKDSTDGDQSGITAAIGIVLTRLGNGGAFALTIASRAGEPLAGGSNAAQPRNAV